MAALAVLDDCTTAFAVYIFGQNFHVMKLPVDLRLWFN